MPRNRFQELLRFYHVSNNDINPTDRLWKIQPLIDILSIYLNYHISTYITVYYVVNLKLDH